MRPCAQRGCARQRPALGARHEEGSRCEQGQRAQSSRRTLRSPGVNTVGGLREMQRREQVFAAGGTVGQMGARIDGGGAR